MCTATPSRFRRLHRIYVRWILTVAGSFVVVLALADLVRTLFHPSEHGNVSDFLTTRVWRLLRRSRRLITSAGPAAFISVLLYWSLSVICGFALIYWAYMPQQFVVSSGMDGARLSAHPFWSSVSVSLANLITVNIGIQTNSVLLQLATGVEAVFGFVILTASISWLLSIYSVIEHRRSLGHEAALLHFAEVRGIRKLQEMEDSSLEGVLFALAEQVLTVRTEHSQFPITYYFQESDERSALLPALQYLAEAAEDVNNSRPPVRMGAVALGGAIDDLLELMTVKYLHKSFESRWDAIAALNADHRRKPLHRETGGADRRVA